MRGPPQEAPLPPVVLSRQGGAAPTWAWWGTGPASLKDSPQRAQGLVVVDVRGAEGRHHRRPRVPTCGGKTRPRRRSAATVLSPPSPPTFIAGRLRPRGANGVMGHLGNPEGP